MPKMTPEQEAAYALDFNVARADLRPAVQEAYDRLVEQRRDGGARGPLSVAEAEAGFRQAVQDARQALEQGRRVYLCRVPMMYERTIDTEIGGLQGPSSVIESIENLGWRLDHMSWVSRGGLRVEGILLFRRDMTAQSGLTCLSRSGCAAADEACCAFGEFALVDLAREGGGAGGAEGQAPEAVFAGVAFVASGGHADGAG